MSSSTQRQQVIFSVFVYRARLFHSYLRLISSLLLQLIIYLYDHSRFSFSSILYTSCIFFFWFCDTGPWSQLHPPSSPWIDRRKRQQALWSTQEIFSDKNWIWKFQHEEEKIWLWFPHAAPVAVKRYTIWTMILTEEDLIGGVQV